MSRATDLHVLIVAEHASAQFGGEAVLPLHHFRQLRRRGVEAWMIVHERTRPELEKLLGSDIARVHFIPDTWLHKVLWRLGKPLPGVLRHMFTGSVMRLVTQAMARRIARRLVRDNRIDVIHQPIPVSPREVSLLYNLGAPVVIGPMNGGMDFPPAFQRMQSRFTRGLMLLGRAIADVPNRLLPGKLRATTLLVANERTRRALPRGVRGKIITLTENGVELELFQQQPRRVAKTNHVRFVFAGRFEALKGIDLLIEAFAPVARQCDATLDIIGDGAGRDAYQRLAQNLGLEHRVRFRGWLPQAQLADEMKRADVLVLPSLRECGGAVVLEAMACGVPVVATRWGGPADYLDDTCGVLVDPADRPRFIAGLTQAMLRLALDPALRIAMGQAGRQRIVREFDWRRKSEQMLEIYAEAVHRWRGGRADRPVGVGVEHDASAGHLRPIREGAGLRHATDERRNTNRKRHVA